MPVRVPQRGDKRELAATVHRNAEHALVLHRTRRAGDLTTRSQALQEIQEALDLPSAPLRIECYDVSHNQGTYQSASMVVFEDGLARKSEYRLFTVRGPEGQGARDDTAAMHEVITRRFRRYLADRADARDVELGDRRGRRRPAAALGPDRRAHRQAGPLRVPAEPRRRRRRPAAGRGRGRGAWPSSGSTTSRCAGWPSGSRRCGCRGRSTR